MIIALCTATTSYELFSKDTVDVSGARTLNMRNIPVNNQFGELVRWLDDPKLLRNVCGLDGADLIAGRSFVETLYFVLKDGRVQQDKTGRFANVLDETTEVYDADSSQPSEFITRYGLYSCASSAGAVFEQDTAVVCDANVRNGLHADITGDGVDDIVYSVAGSFQIAIGARPTSLMCDSSCRVPLIPSGSVQRALVNNDSLYVVVHDTLNSPNSTLHYYRIEFDWQAPLGQEGVAVYVDSLQPPMIGSTLFGSGTVYDDGTQQGYLWVMWKKPDGHGQTVVYTFVESRLSMVTTIDQLLYSMSLVAGRTGDYKPIMMYDVDASRLAYLARIDELHQPFAKLTTNWGALMVEGVLASDQNSDTLPEILFARKAGAEPIAFASFHYEYNRLDEPTTVQTLSIKYPMPIKIVHGELVVDGLNEAYTVEAYDLLGSKLMPTLDFAAPSTINIESLLASLPQQRYFVVVRTAGSYWTLPYTK